MFVREKYNKKCPRAKRAEEKQLSTPHRSRKSPQQSPAQRLVKSASAVAWLSSLAQSPATVCGAVPLRSSLAQSLDQLLPARRVAATRRSNQAQLLAQVLPQLPGTVPRAALPAPWPATAFAGALAAPTAAAQNPRQRERLAPLAAHAPPAKIVARRRAAPALPQGEKPHLATHAPTRRLLSQLDDLQQTPASTATAHFGLRPPPALANAPRQSAFEVRAAVRAL